MSATMNRAITFIVVTVLLDSIGFGIIIPVFPTLITSLANVDLSQASILGGWLLFSFAVVQFFSAPLLGNLSDRYGRRPVLLLSLAMFGVDYLIMGLAPTLAWLFVGRILAGIPGAAYTPAYAYLADVSPPEQRAKHFGMVGAAFGIGFILGPAVGGLLGTLGPRAPFLAAAAVAFANLAFGFFVLPESLPADRRRPFEWRRANPIGALAQLRKYPTVAVLVGVLLLWGIAMQAYPTTWSFYTIFRFGWSSALVGMSLATAGVVMAVSQGALTGRLIPKLGERRTAVYGLLAGTLGFLGYAFATEGWMLFALLGTWLLAALVMPALNALMSREMPPTSQGELQGINASAFSLASIIGPLMMTQLFGVFSKPDAPIVFPGMAWLVAAILGLAGTLVLARMHLHDAAPAPAEPVPTVVGGPIAEEPLPR
ncbi:MAG: TCR/Tet family MFS transporter [Halobacteriales archaeon]|nr:TCR/Tet family MFS transporter [Halobacteriales archaeon]